MKRSHMWWCIVIFLCFNFTVPSFAATSSPHKWERLDSAIFFNLAHEPGYSSNWDNGGEIRLARDFSEAISASFMYRQALSMETIQGALYLLEDEKDEPQYVTHLRLGFSAEKEDGMQRAGVIGTAGSVYPSGSFFRVTLFGYPFGKDKLGLEIVGHKKWGSQLFFEAGGDIANKKVKGSFISQDEYAAKAAVGWQRWKRVAPTIEAARIWRQEAPGPDETRISAGLRFNLNP